MGRVGGIVVVVCWEVGVSLVVVGFGVVVGMLVVNLVLGLVVGAGLGVVVVCWVVVGGAVGCWVGAGLFSLGLSVFRSGKSSFVLTVVEGAGLLVGKVLVCGSWSEISKSTEALPVR